MSTFLDTNVVVYAFDGAEPEKQATAIAILEGKERLVVSTQVLLETWWVLTRRLAEPLGEDAASTVIDTLTQLPVVNTDAELVQRAIRTSRITGVAIWDAMIVEAARSAGCDRVLSEDLQDGRDYGGVVVKNPFSPAHPDTSSRSPG
jgi:predicted nucleic acid-binding protein